MNSSRPVRLLVVCTHPVQYVAPWLRSLARQPGLDLMVWYATIPDPVQQGAGFGTAFQWDIPLLEGYTWRELDNHARDPGPGRFFGTRLRAPGAELTKSRPDAVLVTGWHQYSLVQVAVAARLRGIPLLLRGESNDISPRPAWKRRLQGQYLKLFQRFLYIGEANRRYYLARGVSRDTMNSCPYFVDNERFASCVMDGEAKRQHLRQEWGANPGDTVFLFAGKLQAKKHPDHLLEAFLSWRERAAHDTGAGGGNPVLVFVGDGEMRSALEARSASFEYRVHFAGFTNQQEIVNCYAASDCLVLPSDSGETWGLVVNEAMACGIPAIVSDQVGCAEDLVVDGQTGLLFRFGVQEALIAALEAMYSDPDARRGMGRMASRRVAGYSMNAASEGLEKALDSLGLVTTEPLSSQLLAAHQR